MGTRRRRGVRRRGIQSIRRRDVDVAGILLRMESGFRFRFAGARLPNAGGGRKSGMPYRRKAGCSDFQPRFSPDVRRFAYFLPEGANICGVMDGDGSNPRPVYRSRCRACSERHGRRTGRTSGSGVNRHRASARRQDFGLTPPDGGKGVELVGKATTGIGWPSVSSQMESIVLPRLAASPMTDLKAHRQGAYHLICYFAHRRAR